MKNIGKYFLYREPPNEQVVSNRSMHLLTHFFSIQGRRVRNKKSEQKLCKEMEKRAFVSARKFPSAYDKELKLGYRQKKIQ